MSTLTQETFLSVSTTLKRRSRREATVRWRRVLGVLGVAAGIAVLCILQAQSVRYSAAIHVERERIWGDDRREQRLDPVNLKIRYLNVGTEVRRLRLIEIRLRAAEKGDDMTLAFPQAGGREAMVVPEESRLFTVPLSRVKFEALSAGNWTEACIVLHFDDGRTKEIEASEAVLGRQLYPEVRWLRPLLGGS